MVIGVWVKEFVYGCSSSRSQWSVSRKFNWIKKKIYVSNKWEFISNCNKIICPYKYENCLIFNNNYNEHINSIDNHIIYENFSINTIFFKLKQKNWTSHSMPTSLKK